MLGSDWSCEVGQSGSDRSVSGLQLRAATGRDLHRGGGRADLKRGIDGEHRANLYLQCVHTIGVEAILGERHGVCARRDVQENVAARFVRGGRERRFRGRIDQLDVRPRD